MKYRLALKIALLVLSFVIIVLLIVGMYAIIFMENERFEWSMAISLLIIICGFLAMIYQIKTLKFYKEDYKNPKLEGKLFWIANLLFSFSLCGSSLFMFYSLYTIYGDLDRTFSSEYLIPVLLFGFLLLIGVALALEESWLYKFVLEYERTKHIDSIDDIKGDMS